MSGVGVRQQFTGTRPALGVLWLAACVVVGPLGCGSAQSGGGTAAGAGGESGAEAGQAGVGAEAGVGGAEASDGGTTGDGTGSGDAAAGAAGEATVGVSDTPWNAHSRHVELDCFGFFKGSMLFDADRAELSAEQLRLFDGLRETQSNDQCSADELGCGFAITNDSGDVTVYAADEFDEFCGASPALGYSTVQPLLAGLGCKFALESAASLSASPGCFHGIHASTAAAVIHQQLSLSEANRSYHVELVHCLAGTVSLELLGADPAQPLAVGTPIADPGAKGACVGFDVQVQSPITADLVITTTSSADAVDYYLNFR
jgi:hypothetical protein